MFGRLVGTKADKNYLQELVHASVEQQRLPSLEPSSEQRDRLHREPVLAVQESELQHLFELNTVATPRKDYLSKTVLVRTRWNDSSASSPSHSWTSCSWNRNSRHTLLGRWWTFDGQWHNVLSTQKDKTKTAPFFSFWTFDRLRLEFSELFTICQNQVHVLIECFERPNQRTGILLTI